MEITEVRIKLMEESEDRLRGFCSITFDHSFVVRDLKIIQGNSGPFVAMPSRKLTANCRKCGTKNHLRANYCNNCGIKITSQPIMFDATGRAKLYADIAHPVNARCREMIQRRIVEELNRELELAAQPGYKSRYDDDYDDDFEPDDFSQPVSKKTDLPERTRGERLDQAHNIDTTGSTEISSPNPPHFEETDSAKGGQRQDSPQSQPPSPHDPSDSASSQRVDSSRHNQENRDDDFGKGL